MSNKNTVNINSENPSIQSKESHQKPFSQIFNPNSQYSQSQYNSNFVQNKPINNKAMNSGGKAKNEGSLVQEEINIYTIDNEEKDSKQKGKYLYN